MQPREYRKPPPASKLGDFPQIALGNVRGHAKPGGVRGRKFVLFVRKRETPARSGIADALALEFRRRVVLLPQIASAFRAAAQRVEKRKRCGRSCLE